jgi:glycosyltransferase involved in cell wall biosynthesis
MLLMRIVYIITRADDIGGAQVHVRDVATALHSAGHEVTVLAGSPGTLSDQLAEKGVPFEAVPALARAIAPWRDAQAVRQIRSILRRLRPDLVSVHTSKAGWLGRLAARLSGIPVVLTAHGWAFTEGVPASQRRFYALVERMAGPLADHIITVCDFDRALALEKRIAPPHKITRIHNGVIDHAGPQTAPRHSSPARVIMTGRFSAQKDHAGLLRALAELCDLDWTLALAGDGPSQGDATRLAASLGIADRVDFLGMRKDVRDLLNRSDIYALISNWEGLPYGILEAMSAGLPVIASAVGGVPEAVIDGETGVLVPRDDVVALRCALASLISDPGRRHRLGTAGRRRYEMAFRFDHMLNATLAVYERVATPAIEIAARARQRS